MKKKPIYIDILKKILNRSKAESMVIETLKLDPSKDHVKSVQNKKEVTS